jgi:predicted ATPase
VREKEMRPVLLQFKVKNYKSIADELTIDFSAMQGLREHPSFLMETRGEKVLPVAAFFGNNASGKSNVIKAFWAFCQLIISKNANIEQPTPFLFDREGVATPTEFEIFLAIGGTEYQYGFAVKGKTVEKEWLYARTLSKNNTRWRAILTRTRDVFHYGEAFQFLAAYNHLIVKNMLVLGFFGGKELDKVRAFNEIFAFINKSTIFGPNVTNDIVPLFLPVLHKEARTDFTKRCNAFIREFDPTLQDIVVKHEKTYDGKDNYKLYSVHGGKEFPFDIESDGTRKLHILSVLFHLKLEKGGVLSVDELDCQLHPLILRRIVRAFHDKDLNKGNGQLIFSSHNLIVLDHNDLRRDEIWFVEKDENGKTDIVSLADFKFDAKRIRSDLSYGKNYLAGRFGAVPYRFAADDAAEVAHGNG